MDSVSLPFVSVQHSFDVPYYVQVYAEGPARPMGGTVVVAMLIGPNASISFESKYRASHMTHVYDLYKPHLASEYPVRVLSFVFVCLF